MDLKGLPGVYLNRGIIEFNSHFGQCFIEGRVFSMLERINNGGINLVEKKDKIENKVSLLEVGCGYGNLLMDLSSLFGNYVKLYGIRYDGVEKFECEERNNIRFYEYNAGEHIRFGNETIDFVVSQYAFHYIRDKKRAIEEIWRVLKMGGEAYIHFDTVRSYYIDFMKTETPRFIIRSRGKVVSTEEFFDNLRKAEGKNIVLKNSRLSDHKILVMKKNAKDLRLNLVLDEAATIDLRFFEKDCRYSHKWWGHSSVYDISGMFMNAKRK